MADVPVTVALLVLAQNYRGSLVKQINRRCVALRTLKIVPGAGQNVAIGVQKGGALAENYAEGADATNFGSDGEVPVTLNWGLYRAPFHITEHARRVAATTLTPDGVQNLVANKMQSASSALADVINTSIFTGAGTGTLMTGFDGAIGNLTNTYGGIDRTVGANSFWQPYLVNPGSLTALTLALIRTDLGKIRDAGGECPDVAYVSTDVYNIVAGLFDDNRYYTQNIQTARGDIVLDASQRGIIVEGCTFLPDRSAPANTIYYVNSNYVEIQALPPDPRALEELAAMGGMELLADDGYGAIPLGMVCEKLGRTGASDKYEMLSTVQLIVSRPNSCGVRRNVAT